MATDGDNGSVSTQPYLNRIAATTSVEENRTLDEAFSNLPVEDIARFERMYAKNAIISALKCLGINIQWELRALQGIVLSKKSAGMTKMKALQKIEDIRSTIIDTRVKPITKLPISPAAKAEKEVPPHMRDEADAAADQWEPKEDGG